MISSAIAWVMGSKAARTALAIGAACLALMIAIARIFAAGKKAQRNADQAKTTDILEAQREIAAKPVDAGTARQRLRDGDL